MRRLWLAALLLFACKVKDAPAITQPFVDGYDDRATLGDDYYATGDGYKLANGAVSAHGAHNHPLWLRRRLPRDVQIELDCWSNEPRGDIKVEIFGDGHSYDPDAGRYMATSYVLVFGGWYNAKSQIARMDEHGTELASRTDKKVVPKQHYHWKIVRKGKVVTWWIDDMTTPFLTYEDPHPLEGSGHEYFAFDNWETDTWFDNLVIKPL
ncbi:MAG TPA: hypothetical protein VGM88_28705 [Kofleriaceae bacterium]|jgi:hypothetical protein